MIWTITSIDINGMNRYKKLTDIKKINRYDLKKIENNLTWVGQLNQ